MERTPDARPTPTPGSPGPAGPAARPRPRRIHPALAALLAALLLVPALALAGGGPLGDPDGGYLPGGGFGGPGFFGGAAAAEGDAGGGGEGLHRLPLRRLAHFLDLTEAQIAEARAIFEAARTAAEPLRTARRDLAGQLREALDAAEPDPAAVGALTIALHDNGEALRAVLQGAIEDFEAILTPEQLERFEVLRDARRVFGRGHHRGGPHGPPGGPRGGGPPASGGAA